MILASRVPQKSQKWPKKKNFLEKKKISFFLDMFRTLRVSFYFFKNTLTYWGLKARPLRPFMGSKFWPMGPYIFQKKSKIPIFGHFSKLLAQNGRLHIGQCFYNGGETLYLPWKHIFPPIQGPSGPLPLPWRPNKKFFRKMAQNRQYLAPKGGYTKVKIF